MAATLLQGIVEGAMWYLPVDQRAPLERALVQAEAALRGAANELNDYRLKAIDSWRD